MQLFPVEHGLQGRILQSLLAGKARVPVTLQGLLNLHTINGQRASLRTVRHIQHVFQHLLILLNTATAAVVAKNSKENILVSNILDEFCVCMFRTLARRIFSAPGHCTPT